MQELTSENIQAVVRHSLTFIGGIAVNYGWIDEQNVVLMAGAIATLAGVAWSVWQKNRQNSTVEQLRGSLAISQMQVKHLQKRV